MPDEQSTQEETVPTLVFDMKEGQILVNKPLASEIFENGYFGIWTDKATLCLEPEEILLEIKKFLKH